MACPHGREEWLLGQGMTNLAMHNLGDDIDHISQTQYFNEVGVGGRQVTKVKMK